MRSNSASTDYCYLKVVDLVGVCRLCCVGVAIVTVGLHKTTRSSFDHLDLISYAVGPPSRLSSWEGFRWSGPV